MANMMVTIPHAVLLNRLKELDETRNQALRAIGALEQEQARIASTFVKNPAKWSDVMERAYNEYKQLDQAVGRVRGAYTTAEQNKGRKSGIENLEMQYRLFKLAEEWINAALMYVSPIIRALAWSTSSFC